MVEEVVVVVVDVEVVVLVVVVVGKGMRPVQTSENACAPPVSVPLCVTATWTSPGAGAATTTCSTL